MQITIDRIIKNLKNHLNEDANLRVEDESHLHYGHKESDPSKGVTHISIVLVWHGFHGMKIIERQRMVNNWLSEFFKEGLHAVTYILKTPSESLS